MIKIRWLKILCLALTLLGLGLFLIADQQQLYDYKPFHPTGALGFVMTILFFLFYLDPSVNNIFVKIKIRKGGEKHVKSNSNNKKIKGSE